MTIPWVDDPDMESAEYESEAEGLFGDSDVDADFESDFDTEDIDAESRAAQARRRRARARRVAMARRRQSLARARSMARQPARQPSKAVSPTQRATAATARAVRNLDLETKVQEDTFRSAITAQNKRMSRGEYAAVAGAAVNQFIETFEAPDNVYARAALRFSPLLLLAPQRKGRGLEGLIKDPRVIGGAAVAALVVVGDLREKSNRAHHIRISAPATLVQNSSTTVFAEVLDKDGKPLSKEKVVWSAEPATVATVTELGANTATLAAPDTAATTNTSAVITATCGDIVGRHFLTVTPN